MNQTHDHQVVTEGEYYQHDQRPPEHEIMEEYSEKQPPPKKRPLYKNKKYVIFCGISTVIIVVVVVVLALYVIFPKIAQSLLNQSNITVNAADITFTKPADLDGNIYSKRDGDDLNTTFYMNLESSLSNTGPFSATIKFQNPVNVYYNDTYLGDIYFYNQSHIGGGHGSLNAVTPFLIRDVNAFADFTKVLLAVDEFKWTLKGKLSITALTRLVYIKETSMNTYI
jgi:hypothetical protein